MLRPYLKIWDWDLIFGRAVKALSSPGVRSPCSEAMNRVNEKQRIGEKGWVNHTHELNFLFRY